MGEKSLLPRSDIEYTHSPIRVSPHRFKAFGMILIWQRLGCLAVIVPVVIIVLFGMAASGVGGSDPETADMVKKGGAVGGCFFAALVTGALGFVLNRKTRTIEADPVSGDPVVVEEGGGHTLFWIPMQYWGIAWAILGVVWMFTK